jgi:hypothetical protein
MIYLRFSLGLNPLRNAQVAAWNCFREKGRRAAAWDHASAKTAEAERRSVGKSRAASPSLCG